jgi:hypothetical protein
MRRKSKYVALAFAIACALALILLLPGCVSFPLPPTGESAGRYGYIDIKVQYRPNFDTALQIFRNSKEQPKPTSSK